MNGNKIWRILVDLLPYPEVTENSTRCIEDRITRKGLKVSKLLTVGKTFKQGSNFHCSPSHYHCP